MAKIKTKQTEADVHAFINAFADTEQKRADSFELLKIWKILPAMSPGCGGQP